MPSCSTSTFPTSGKFLNPSNAGFYSAQKTYPAHVPARNLNQRRIRPCGRRSHLEESKLSIGMVLKFRSFESVDSAPSVPFE